MGRAIRIATLITLLLMSALGGMMLVGAAYVGGSPFSHPRHHIVAVAAILLSILLALRATDDQKALSTLGISLAALILLLLERIVVEE